MSTKLRKTLVVLVALAVVGSMAGVGAAAIAWDTETTTTTTTSDLSGSSTTVTFNPDNDSKSVYIEVDGAPTSNLTVEFTPATAGVDYVAYENSTPSTENSANGHYSWNLSHSELGDIPRKSTGATYNVSVYNTSGDNHTELLTTEVVLDSDGVNEKRAIIAVSDDSGTDAAALTPLVADTLELSTKSSWFSLNALTFGAFGDEDNGTDVAHWSGYTVVNGSSTDVTVKMANSTTASAYDSAASDREDGEALKSATITINGVPHLVYKNEAPEDYPDNTTLVVYDTTSDQLEIDLGGEYEIASNLRIDAAAGDGYGFWELTQNFGYTKAFQVAW